MERIITESVSNKKKLEAIKSQRQKDGSELSAMRHLKDKALQVKMYTVDYPLIRPPLGPVRVS